MLHAFPFWRESQKRKKKWRRQRKKKSSLCTGSIMQIISFPLPSLLPVTVSVLVAKVNSLVHVCIWCIQEPFMVLTGHNTKDEGLAGGKVV